MHRLDTTDLQTAFDARHYSNKRREENAGKREENQLPLAWNQKRSFPRLKEFQPLPGARNMESSKAATPAANLVAISAVPVACIGRRLLLVLFPLLLTLWLRILPCRHFASVAHVARYRGN